MNDTVTNVVVVVSVTSDVVISVVGDTETSVVVAVVVSVTVSVVGDTETETVVAVVVSVTVSVMTCVTFLVTSISVV